VLKDEEGLRLVRGRSQEELCCRAAGGTLSRSLAAAVPGSFLLARPTTSPLRQGGHVTDFSFVETQAGSVSEQMSMLRPLSSTLARSFARAAHVHARASSAAASKPAAAVAPVMGRKDQDRAGAGARSLWATSPLGSRSMSTVLTGGPADVAPAGGQPAAPAGGPPAGLSPPAQAVMVDEQNFNAVVQTLGPK